MSETFSPHLVELATGQVIRWDGLTWTNEAGDISEDRFLAADGSAAAPSHSFSSADGTGWYLSGSSLTAAVGGTTVLLMSDSQFLLNGVDLKISEGDLVLLADITSTAVRLKAHDTTSGEYTLTMPQSVADAPVAALVSNASGALSYVPAWTPVKKTADETRNSDATITADDTLAFAMAANTSYLIRGRVLFSTAATPDYQYDWNAPSGASIRIAVSTLNAGGVNALGGADTALATARTSVGNLAGDGWVDFEGLVSNGDNAGDLEFRWAQNTSDAGDTTVRSGSYIEHQQQ
jgi:hypothetical protein